LFDRPRGEAFDKEFLGGKDGDDERRDDYRRSGRPAAFLMDLCFAYVTTK
jgi:hypothetical protein